MSTEVTKTGETTGPKYSFYDKDYDYNTFRRIGDAGIKDFIHGLKGGKKEYDLYYKAWLDFANAMKDGRISYNVEEGLFNDSNHILENTDLNKNKYLGAIARYAYNTMNGDKMSLWEDPNKPKEKTDISDRSEVSRILGEGLSNYLFLTKSPTATNYNNFIDRDEYKDSVRGYTNRISDLNNGLKYLTENLNNLFTTYNFTDDYQTLARELISKALNQLNNGFGNDDLLALSNLAPTLDWRQMMTGLLTYAATSALNLNLNLSESQWWSGFENYASKYNTPSTYTDRLSYLLSIEPTRMEYLKETDPKTGERAMQENRFNEALWKDYVNHIKNMSLSDRQALLRDIIYNTDKDFYADSRVPGYTDSLGRPSHMLVYNNVLARALVESMIDDILENNGYISGLDNTQNNTGFVFDSKTGKIVETPFSKIPYWQAKILNEYNNLTKGITVNPEYLGYYDMLTQLQLQTAQSYKQGGILKALSGVVLTNKYKQLDINKINLDLILKNIDDEKYKGHYEKDNEGNYTNIPYWVWLNEGQSLYAKLRKNEGDNYQTTPITNEDIKTYQQRLISGYNNEFEEGSGGYNLYGIKYGFENGMFDTGTGNSGDNLSQNWVADGMWSGITHARTLLGYKGDYDPETEAEYVEAFAKKGYRFYLDKDDAYKLEPLNNLTSSKSLYNGLDPQTQLNLEIEKIGPNKGGKKEDPTDIKLGDSPDKEGKGGKGKWQLSLFDKIPDLIGLARLPLSLHYNNKIARTLHRDPITLNWETQYYRPDWDLATTQFYNNLGAEGKREMRNFGTSDASLAMAGLDEGNRRYNELSTKGNLIANQDWDKDLDKQWLAAVYSSASAIKGANANLVSHNQTANDNKDIEATKHKSNWGSLDNAIAEQLYKKEIKDLKQEALYEEFMGIALALDRQEAYSKLEQYAKDHNLNTPADKLADPKYVEMSKAIESRFGYETLMALLGYRNSNPYKTVPKSYDEIFAAKQGGKLNLKTLSLLNNVIRNANNT